METYPLIFLSKSTVPKILPSDGVYSTASNNLEIELANKLTELFPSKIFSHQKVGFYYPDISLIDRSKNIYIDIEIDEPYSKSGQPTHFIQCKNDTLRDLFFIENGWHVIRFSENQVLNHLNLVISTLHSFYDSLVEKKDFNVGLIKGDFIQKRWTYTQALHQMQHIVRDYYNSEVHVIDENKQSLLCEFSNLGMIFDKLIAHFNEYDHENEIIFLPYFISAQYKDKKDSSRLLFINCSTSDGRKSIHGKVFTYNLFSNNPKIEIIDSSKREIFDIIYEKKTMNQRIYIDEVFGEKYYYDFFFKGTMKDYFEGNLEFYPDLNSIVESGL